ncbi:putative photosystem II PsbX [Helianthus annuus]|uniref:Photosystem II PsbX n=1 Tax=Helianthus annuus TaxID=4232 RepID=A0A251V362_HELAN|nr:uncharacterized protein LOC110928439 [Helianthus annuus]KAF5812470.1 putative photosystem II PsbX [Helianthus annuus]KAJ0495611.1 putative photosystem II PsbX [Helianthus annuus]KAJ0606311.1 putative photosystem II PsbX [Helianthus annuus]KAJ0766405.1 putative photosystem II PsbX [Helianthus annuus]KAJ0933592.1 putative photosystem II PsbX [Helianthus annuus]
MEIRNTHLSSQPSFNLTIFFFSHPSQSKQASSMASTCALSMAMPLTHKKATLPPTTSFFNPLTLNLNSKTTTPAAASKQRLVVVKSSMKENAVTALTAAVLTASMVVPEVAQAASGVTPSLNNFLLSIGAGGIVLGGILGAIIGVSNFDPVKRG